MTQLRPCSRCRVRPASTERNAYCKACRAAYQREWRARQKYKDYKTLGTAPGRPRLHVVDAAEPPDPGHPRVRLRATPTQAEMRRYRLI